MNTTLTYHCPCCGAGLSFDPEKQLFSCEYCLSEFTEEDLAAKTAENEAAEEAARAAEEAARAAETPDEEFSAGINLYACGACGAEVQADESTAATICPYCHNPVILTGKLSGQMKPHKIIPFAFDKEGAKQRFGDYISKKWFVPRDFKSASQLDKITGIYYPFWVTDADAKAAMAARATRVRTWYAGDYRYTETSKFHVYREGYIHFEDIVTPAITEEDREMLDGILPYPSDSLQPFSMPYLSGFLTKKRDIEREAVREAVRARMVGYSATLLRGTIGPYTTVTPATPRLFVNTIHWDYTLMPIFLMTYRHGKKTYTYAMNGYTGKLYGRLPVSGKKLALLGTVVGALVGVAAALVKYFLL